MAAPKIRQRHLARATAFAGLLLAFYGCGRPPADESIPETPPEFEPEVSRIETPVEIPLDQLRDLVDRRISGQIHSETRNLAPGVAVDVAVSRRDAPISIEISGNRLTTRIPLHVDGGVTVGVGPFRVERPDSLDADLDVRLMTAVGIDSDWTVVVNSTIEVDVNRADVTGPGFRADATTILQELMDRNADKMAAPIDNFLEELDLRTRLEPIWTAFRAPIQLIAEPPVWLRVRPVRFSESPPIASGRNLTFDIGMEAYLESVVGDRPGDLDLGDIPPLGEASGGSGAFNVALPIALDLEAASEAISDRIVGREDSIGSRATVRWLGFELRGTGNRLQANVRFEANTGIPIVDPLVGTMAIAGRPAYDRESQTLTVAGLEYELQSNSRLAGLADWLLHDRLRDRIQAELVFPFGDVITRFRQRLQGELERVSLGPYGTLAAEIGSLTAESVRVGNSKIELLVRAEGRMRLSVTLDVN